MTFAKIALDVSTKKEVNGKKEYVKVGSVDIHVPTLEDAGIAGAVQEKDKDGKPLVTEEGLPVYSDDKFNWLQNAIFAQVKAQARNKLVNGTVELKPGNSIATDWDTLTAEAQGTGEALAIVREAKQAMAAWAASLGKSAGAQSTITGMFGNKQALALQTPANKQKIEQYVTDFAASLNEAQLARFEKYIQSVLDVCQTTTDMDDF